MKKALLAGVAVLWLFTGFACNTSDIVKLIAEVQADTTKACAFVPTAETIIAIFGQNNSTLQSAASIATAICSAVAPKTLTATPDASVPGAVVAGVQVKGHWVVK